MFKPLHVLAALAVALNAAAAEPSPAHRVDLRESGAIERLQQSNPDHYSKIRRVVDALTAEPKLAEGSWLQVNVAARDVDLSRYLIRTSNPPKQLLQFTLDDTRYVMHVVRSDMTAEITPTK